MDDDDKKDKGSGSNDETEKDGRGEMKSADDEGIEKNVRGGKSEEEENPEEMKEDEEVMELDMEGEVIEDDAEKSKDIINTEALYRELELECVALRQQRDQLRSTVEKQWEDITKLNRFLSESQKEAREKEEALRSKERAEEDARCQRERVERVNVEADTLRGEISRLSESNEKLTSQVGKLRSQCSVSESSRLPLQYQVDRIQTEMDALTSHCRYLEDQLADRNTQMSNAKQEQATIVNDLHAQIHQISFDRDSYHANVQALQRQIASLEQDFEKDHNQLRGILHERSDALLASQEDLRAQQSLNSLLNAKCDDFEANIHRIANESNAFRDVANRNALERDELAHRLQQRTKELEDAQQQHNLQIQDYQQKLQLAKSTPTQSTAVALIEPSNTTAVIESLNLPPTPSLTTLIDKLTSTQHELRSEQNTTKQLEIYLQKIRVDIEAKAPLLKQQRQEYEIALKDKQEAQNRLNDALKEQYALQNRLDVVESNEKQCQSKNEMLTQENRDLAVQIQTLLQQQQNPPEEEDLISFSNVQELQSQNQKLLRQYRALTAEVEELQRCLDQDKLQSSLDSTVEELTQLKEEKEHQATLMNSIVQQRDMYRALLAKSDAQFSEREGSTTSMVHQKQEDPALIDQIQKFKNDLIVANNDNDALKQRNTRLDAQITELSSSIDALHAKLSTANSQQAKLIAEMSFYVSKCDRLEEGLERSQKNLTHSEASKKEMLKVNSELQQLLTSSRAKAEQYQQELSQSQTTMRLMEVQLRTAKTSEARVILESDSLQKELAQQGLLLESIRKIEASLSEKASEQYQSLRDQVQSLEKKLHEERTRHTTQMDNYQNSITDLELNVSSLATKKEETEAFYLKSQEELVKAKADMESYKKKCIEFEHRLGTNPPENESATTLELESSKAQIASLQNQISEYRSIARSSESALKEMTETSEIYKQNSIQKIQEMQSSLETLQNEKEDVQLSLKETQQDLEKQRNDQNGMETKLKSEIESLKQETRRFEEHTKDAFQKVESLTLELSKLQDDITSAQKNYERELNLHAEARTQLRTMRADADSERRLRETFEDRYSTEKASMEQERVMWEEAKTKLEGAVREMETRLEQSRAQNSLLHSQLATVSETVDNFQKERIHSIPKSSEEEMASLCKSQSELREIVNYMRSEREILDGQLDALRRTAERERAAAAITQRSLDEARAELQALRDGAEIPAVPTEGEEQLLILQESNSLLRTENERLGMKLRSAEKELEDARLESETVEERIRALEVDKATLRSDKESREREAEVWKGRVQSLVSTFNQIDPEEHAKVIAQAETLRKECETLAALKETAEQETTKAKASVSELNQKVSQLQSSLDTSTEKLTKALSEKEELSKSHKATGEEIVQERNQLKEKIKKMELELEAARTDVTSVKKRVENLTGILRRQKSVIADLTQKHQDSISKEEEKQKLVEKEQKEKEALMKEVDSLKSMAKESAKDIEIKQVMPVSSETVSASRPSIGQKDTKEAMEVIPEKTAAPSATPVQPTAATSTPSADASEASELEVPSGGFRFAPSKNNASAEVHVKPLDTGSALDITGASPSDAYDGSAPLEHASMEPTINISPPPPVQDSTETEPKPEQTLREKLLMRKRKLAAELKESADSKQPVESSDPEAESQPKKKRAIEDVDIADAQSKKAKSETTGEEKEETETVRDEEGEINE